MKQFNDFINENRDDDYRKPYESLIEPLENIIQKLLNHDNIEVFCYSGNFMNSENFIITFQYPYKESGDLRKINSLVEKNIKDNEILYKLQGLEKDFNSKDIYIEYANSLYWSVKYNIGNEYLNSNYFNSLRSIGKFNL